MYNHTQRMWDMSLCLCSHAPCSFSTFLHVAMVTHVTPRDVLYELRKVTSGKNEAIIAPLAYCFLMHLILLDNIYSKKWSMSRSRIGTQNAAIMVFTEHASAVHAPRCNDLWSNVTRLSRDYHVYIIFLSVLLQERCCRQLFEEILARYEVE